MSYKWASLELQKISNLCLGICKGCAVTLTNNQSIGRVSRNVCGQRHRYSVVKLRVNGTSTERPWFLVMQVGQCKGCEATLTHNRTIGCHSKEKCLRQHCYYVLELSVNGASMEHEQFLGMQLGKSKGCAATLTHNRTIGRSCRQSWFQQHRYYVLKMNVNGASTTFGLLSWNIREMYSNINPWSNCWPPFSATMLSPGSQICRTIECQRSINRLWLCIWEHPTVGHRHERILTILAAFVGKNATNNSATAS